MPFNPFGSVQSAFPQQRQQGGGGSFLDRILAQRQGGGQAGAGGGFTAAGMGGKGMPGGMQQMQQTKTGPMGTVGRSPAPASGGLAGMIRGMQGGGRPAGGGGIMGGAMGAAQGIAGGGGAPRPMGPQQFAGVGGAGGMQPPARQMAMRPMQPPAAGMAGSMGSALGGMAMMSDEEAKKNAYLKGLDDRFASLDGAGMSPEEREEEKQRQEGFNMFKSGLGSIGR